MIAIKYGRPIEDDSLELQHSLASYDSRRVVDIYWWMEQSCHVVMVWDRYSPRYDLDCYIPAQVVGDNPALVSDAQVLASWMNALMIANNLFWS